MEQQDYTTALYQAARNGDRASYENLTASWRQPLWQEAASWCGSGQLAGAAVQQALEQGFSHIGQTADPAGLYALLRQQTAAFCARSMPVPGQTGNRVQAGTGGQTGSGGQAGRSRGSGGLRGKRLAALLAALALTVTGVLGALFQALAVERFPAASEASDPESLFPTEPVPEAQAPEADPYREAMEAYLALLTEKQKGIEAYDWQKSYHDKDRTNRPVAILDICGDEIPELIYQDVDLSQEYVYMTDLHILTWENGRLRTLYERGWDAQAGGGFRYLIFQTSESKALYAMMSFGDESWSRAWVRLTEEEDEALGVTLAEEPLLEWYSSIDYNSPDYKTVVTCRKNGTEISEEDFDRALTALYGSVSEVVMRGANYSDYPETFQEDYRELAVSAAEAILDLTVQTAPEGEARRLDPGILPKDALSFLQQFVGWYDNGQGTEEYDCGAALQGPSLLSSIIHNGSCARFSIYPGGGQTDFWGERDPRGWADAAYPSYAAFDAESVDWIAIHIFHLPAEGLAGAILAGEETHSFYRQAGEDGKDYYYRPIGGVGDPFLKIIPFAVTMTGDGQFCIDYDVYFDTEWESRYPSSDGEYQYTARALMGWEEIDGTRYWTLFTNTRSQPEAEAPTPEPDLFARIPTSYIFTSGLGGWGTQLLLSDDGSFQGNFEDSNYGESGDGYDGTVYYCNFRGRFENPRRIDESTYAFDLAELVTLEEQGTEEIVDYDSYRIRYAAATPYGMEKGKTFYLYTPEALSYRLPEEFRWWYFAAYGGDDGGPLGGWGLYNAEGESGFRGSTLSAFDTWDAAYADFVLDQHFYSNGDLAVGVGNVNPDYNDTPPRFALCDPDGDGSPELAVFNGRAGDEAADYLFTFRNRAVRYVESREAGALTAEGWLYDEIREAGWSCFTAHWFSGDGSAVREIVLPDGEAGTALDWGWDLFREDPANYSGPLARAGAILCLDPDAAEENLTALGFGKVRTVDAGGALCAAIGSRLLYLNGEYRPVISVTVTEAPGLGFEGQARLLPQLDDRSDSAVSRLVEELREYLEKLEGDFNAERTLWYLTGYGLGGAAAAKLSPLLFEEGVGEDAVFVYTYGCPGYAEDPEAEAAPFQHNLLLTGDLLAQLPTGRGRPGEDRYLDGEGLTLAESHALQSLADRLGRSGDPDPLPAGAGRFRRLTLPNRGSFACLDQDGVFCTWTVTDPAVLTLSPDFLIYGDREEMTVLARADCSGFLSVRDSAALSTSLRIEDVDLRLGTVTETARIETAAIPQGERLCVPMAPEEDPRAVAYLTAVDGGRTRTRLLADGTTQSALFDRPLLGWIFVGAAGLGLAGVLLALLLRKRR